MLDKPPVPTATPQSGAAPAGPAPADVAAILGKGRSRGRTRRVVIGIVVVLAVAAAAFWWTHRDRAAGVNYLTTVVARGDLTVSVTAAGTIQPINQVDVSSELSGTIGTVNVDFNTPVKAGETLATLKTDKLDAAVQQGQATLAARAADVAQAKAATDQAKTALDRAKQLRAMGTITQEALDTAQSTYDKSIAALDAANANQQIATANLSIAQSDRDKATIVSPIDGVVLSRNIDVGQTVAASLSAPVLFTLAEDLAKMQLEVDIDEADVGKVAEGDKAEFTVAAYEDQSFPATVSQIRFAPEKVEGVVTYKAILTVDNSSKLLRPGMTATATITVSSVSNALLVPNAALRYTPPSTAAGPGGILGILRGGPPGGGGGGGGPVLVGPGGAGAPPPGAAPPTAGPGQVLIGNGGAAGAARTGAAGGAPAQAPPAPGTVTPPRVVWVLRDGKPTPLAVRTGVTDGSRTEIIGGGLTEQDAVITGSKAAT